MIWEKIAADRLKVIEKQQKELEALKRLVKELSEKIARLEKNPANSSKPPSSDITKPPKQEGGKGQKRTPGAQKGHKKHERTPFPPEQIDKTIVHEVSRCPCCGGRLEPVKENAETRQQITETDRNLFGPKLTAVTACLKGSGRPSYTVMQAALNDIFGIQVSTGFPANQIRLASESLGKPYEELAGQLPEAGRLHVDETGWKGAGEA